MLSGEDLDPKVFRMSAYLIGISNRFMSLKRRMDPETCVGSPALYKEGFGGYGGHHVGDIGIFIEKGDKLRPAYIRP